MAPRWEGKLQKTVGVIVSLERVAYTEETDNLMSRFCRPERAHRQQGTEVRLLRIETL